MKYCMYRLYRIKNQFSVHSKSMFVDTVPDLKTDDTAYFYDVGTISLRNLSLRRKTSAGGHDRK